MWSLSSIWASSEPASNATWWTVPSPKRQGPCGTSGSSTSSTRFPGPSPSRQSSEEPLDGTRACARSSAGGARLHELRDVPRALPQPPELRGTLGRHPAALEAELEELGHLVGHVDGDRHAVAAGGRRVRAGAAA